MKMKKNFVIILQSLSGVLVPLFFCLAAHACAFYNQVFVNISIPFVIIIPLWIGIKVRRKSKPFFVGTLFGLLVVLVYIIFGFVKINQASNGLSF